MRVVLLTAGLILILVVFGVAGFIGYQLYIKPRELEKAEARRAAVAPTPPPDYSIPAYEKAIQPYKSGDLFSAREALADFIVNYPHSTKLAEAKKTLGDINTSFVYSAMDGPDKITYTVARGDALVKIATKAKSNAELIFRANNLESINLKIGQQLRIPQLEISLVVDRNANTLTLLNKGRFFKEYPILSLKAPGLRSTAPVEAKVNDKVALKGADRVAFGEKNYLGSERWIMLNVGGALIRGAPQGVTDPASLPAGIVLSQEDIEEIFPLVTRGIPVTIR